MAGENNCGMVGRAKTGVNIASKCWQLANFTEVIQSRKRPVRGSLCVSDHICTLRQPQVDVQIPESACLGGCGVLALRTKNWFSHGMSGGGGHNPGDLGKDLIPLGGTRNPNPGSNSDDGSSGK